MAEQQGGNGQDRRKISRIMIRDVLAIEEMALELDGAGLEISGRMASGKTSILDSVSAAFGKTNRAELLRQGTDRGELLIVLDDGHQIERVVTPGGLSSPIVRAPDGSVMKKPSDFLSGLMSALALNPVEFINATEARQLRMLADAFPVDVSIDELQELAGGRLNVEKLVERSDLRGLDLLQAALRQINGSLRDTTTLKDRALEQAAALRGGIPAGFRPDDIRGVSSADLASELARIHQHNKAVQDATNNLAKVTRQTDQITNEMAQVADQIRQLQERLENLTTRQKTATNHKEELEAWINSNPPAESAPLEDRLNNLDAQRAILANFDRAAELENEARALDGKHEALASAKKKLADFPATLTSRAQIPIEGLSIDGDGLRVNGLPIGNLSDGEKLRLAIQVAAAGASDLGVVCIDGAERMSEQEREKLLTSLEKMGLQFFITEVSDDDLAIRQRVPGEKRVEQARSAPAPVQAPVGEPDATAELRALFAEAQLGSPLVTEASLTPAQAPAPTPELSPALAVDDVPGFDEPAGIVEEPAAARELVVEQDLTEVPLGFDEQSVAPDVEAIDDIPPGFDDDTLAAAPGFDGDGGIPPGFDGDYEDSLKPAAEPSSGAAKASSDAFNFGF